jgi:phage baseplate assembly protein gpV
VRTTRVNTCERTWVRSRERRGGRERGYWTKRIGEADDYDEADGEKVLTFYQA